MASEESQPGDVISYGDKVVILHRASQKFVVKSKVGLGDGFRAALDSITPMPSYVRSKLSSDTADDENLEQKNTKYVYDTTI